VPIRADVSLVVNSAEVNTMKMRRIPSYVVLMTVAVMVMSAAPATAQGWISYAAKFVCNAEGTDDSVMSGKYRTVVNIHNPHNLLDDQRLPTRAVFSKKVVLAQPQGKDPLPPSCHQLEGLPADYALAVNCANIKTLLALSGLPTTGLLEGFVVIEVGPHGIEVPVTPTLDVVTVYTARPRTGIDPDVRIYDVRDLEVERVLPTDIIGDPVQRPCDPQ